MTVHLTDVQEERLEAIAARNGISPEEMAQQVVNQFLDDRERHIAAVREGMAAAERGELIDHEDVLAMLDDIVANG